MGPKDQYARIHLEKVSVLTPAALVFGFLMVFLRAEDVEDERGDECKGECKDPEPSSAPNY